MGTRRAFAFSFLDRYSGLLLAIGSSMVISRLLTPAEVGVFSVTMVLIVFAQSLRDLGAGQYLVQEKDLTPDRIRATWTVLLGAGILVGVVVALAALPVAHFYGEPRMAQIMWVIAINFVVNPFGSMTYAWLIREMRFDALAVMRFGSGVAGAGTSIWLAWQGWGPISLAWGNLAATLINATLALRFRPPQFGWLPGVRGVREVIGYGSQISGTGLILNVASGAPDLLLGKLQNLTAAGLYSRGNGLAQMFQRLVLDATQAVAIPIFARTRRESGSIKEPFLHSLSYVTALGWSFLTSLALLAHPLTRLLYGDQWDASVPVTQLLACAMGIGLTASMCGAVLMGIGQARELLLLTAIVVPVQVGCIALGAMHSLQGVGLAVVVAQVIVVPIWLIRIRRLIGFEWSALVRTLWRSALVAGLTATAPLGTVAILGLRPAAPALALLCAAAGGALLFALAVRLTKHPIDQELSRLYAVVSKRLDRMRRQP